MICILKDKSPRGVSRLVFSQQFSLPCNSGSFFVCSLKKGTVRCLLFSENIYQQGIKLSAEELMLLNCGVGEDSWESLGLQGDTTSPFWRRSALGFLWKEWCWSWNSSTLVTSCEELTHWKRLWCWEGLGAGGKGDDRGWDGWMASLTRWMWVSVNSGSWWWTGRPGVL